MSKVQTKADLIIAADNNYERLNAFICELTEKELSTEFDFTKANKKEAHWNRDKNLRDVLIHLYEWHQLLLNWVKANINGENKSFIPMPYNWKTYGDMNAEFWKKHQDTSLTEAKAMFKASHEEVMSLAKTFSDEKLFTKGVYAWALNTTLGSYFASTTASHYDWALKKLKAHKKNCAL